MIIKTTFEFISFSLLNSINFMIIFIARNIVIIYLFHLKNIIILIIKLYIIK